MILELHHEQRQMQALVCCLKQGTGYGDGVAIVKYPTDRGEGRSSGKEQDERVSKQQTPEEATTVSRSQQTSRWLISGLEQPATANQIAHTPGSVQSARAKLGHISTYSQQQLRTAYLMIPTMTTR